MLAQQFYETLKDTYEWIIKLKEHKLAELLWNKNFGKLTVTDLFKIFLKDLKSRNGKYKIYPISVIKALDLP